MGQRSEVRHLVFYCKPEKVERNIHTLTPRKNGDLTIELKAPVRDKALRLWGITGRFRFFSLVPLVGGKQTTELHFW